MTANIKIVDRPVTQHGMTGMTGKPQDHTRIV